MFRKKERTPAQQASRAQMGIFARLAGCAYLIYVLYKLLSLPASERPNQTLTVLIAIVLIGGSAFIIAITVRDFLIDLKSGRYKQGSYESEESEGDAKNGETEDVTDTDTMSGAEDESDEAAASEVGADEQPALPENSSGEEDGKDAGDK